MAAALAPVILTLTACNASRAEIPLAPTGAHGPDAGRDGAGRSRSALETWQAVVDEAAGASGGVPVRDRAAALRGLIDPSVSGDDSGLRASVDLLSCAAAAIPHWVPKPCGASGEFVRVTMKFGGSAPDAGACATNADLRAALLKRGWTVPPVASPPAVTVDDGVMRLTRDSGLVLEDVLQSSPFVFARISPSANFPPRCQFEFSLIAL